MEFRIALVGFGNVGQGFSEILLEKGHLLKHSLGLDAKIVAISDIKHGSIWVEDGIDLKLAMELVKEGGNLERYPTGVKGLNSIETIRRVNANVVVEATWTNLEDGEPGITHVRTALELGRHVITTNKGPIALAYRELKRIADERGVFLRFEGTVMSGTPAISTALETLAGNEIEEIYGIVNGTTNFILTEMEAGRSYGEALREAQKLGYAEADPSMDVDGWDAAAKAAILANVVMDGDVKVRDLERVGIREISKERVQSALGRGMRVKLIARVWRQNGEVKARVKPEEIDLKHPLASVTGVTNALVFKTDHLGEVVLIGPGAGRKVTGQAVLSDLLAMHRVLR